MLIANATAPVAPSPGQKPEADLSHLKDLAVEFEAVFLAEMLKGAGLGETGSSFSGGVGESQFASFLRDAQARKMALSGGLGLSEQIFEALKEARHEL